MMHFIWCCILICLTLCQNIVGDCSSGGCNSNETLSAEQLKWYHFLDVFYLYCSNSAQECNASVSTVSPYIYENRYISQLSDYEPPCCAPCTCGTGWSEEIRCPGMVSDIENSKTFQRCHSTFVKFGTDDIPYHEYEPYYNMIDRCDPRWINMSVNTQDSDMLITIRKCHQSHHFPDFYARMPVSSAFNHEVYINRYCAECNFVPLIKNWIPTIGCIEGTFDMTDTENIISLIRNSENCNMAFVPPVGFFGRSCISPISKCNITGQWDVYDPLIKQGCDNYDLSFQMIYRNVYCYICNTNYATRRVPPCYDMRTVFISFKLILNLQFYENEDKNGLAKDEVCDENEIYDKIQDDCLRLKCLPYKILSQGMCVNSVESIYGKCYESFVKMTPTYPTPLTDQESDLLVRKTLMSHLLEKDKVFTSIRRSDTDDVIYILNHVISCFLMSDDHVSTKRLDSILNIHNTTVSLKSDVKFHVELDLFSYTSELGNDETVNITYTDYNTNETFTSVFKDFPRSKIPETTTNRPNNSEHASILAPDDIIWETLLPLHMCPVVELNSSVYSIVEYHWGIFVKEIGLSLKRNEYILRSVYGNDSVTQITVIVCKNTFPGAFSNISSPGIRLLVNSPLLIAFESVLTLSCTTISIACCFVTIICYACLKDMQTQPCINTLSLVVSLVVAQSLFQFGIGQASHVENWVCQTIGILTHYFWLVTILWMNVCSYHMYNVFRKYTLPIRHAVKKTVTIRYWTYCLSVATLPVLANIVTEIVRSRQQHIGYGGVFCYISDNIMVAYCFVGPMALVIASNMYMFAVTIIKISATQTNTFFEQDRSFLIIYVKLSTVTGVTWIFGFLYLLFQDIDAFGYLFIIFNAGQGLLIFVSFICTKRALNCLKKAITSNLSFITKTERLDI